MVSKRVIKQFYNNGTFIRTQAAFPRCNTVQDRLSDACHEDAKETVQTNNTRIKVNKGPNKDLFIFFPQRIVRQLPKPS